MDGTSGNVAFDWYGDRKNAVYQLLNVRKENETSKPKTKHVGTLYNKSNIDINVSDIIWPGNEHQVSDGLFISSHLRVSPVYI